MNGTFVNGRRITRCTLTHGDVVVTGKHTLVFNHLADMTMNCRWNSSEEQHNRSNMLVSSNSQTL